MAEISRRLTRARRSLDAPLRILGLVLVLVGVASCGSAGAGSTIGTTEPERQQPSEAALIEAADQRASAMLRVDGRGMWETLTEKCQSTSTPGQVTDYLGFRRLQLRDQTGVDLENVAVNVAEATVDGAIGHVRIDYSTGDPAADDVLAAEDLASSPWIWDGQSWRHPDCTFRN